MTSRERDAIEAYARQDIKDHNPSQDNPVPVLVAKYDRLTGAITNYVVAVVVSIGKVVWERDKLSTSGRRHLRGVPLHVMHAIDADTLAVVKDQYEPALYDIERAISKLQRDRKRYLVDRARRIEKEILKVS